MKIKKVIVVYTRLNNKVQKETFNLVKKTLKKHRIRFIVSIREKLSKNMFKNKDLVLVVGGDGTFLMASHFVLDKTLLFGVNSDPSCREGFFMVADGKDFEKKFDKLLNGNFEVRKLHRLEAYRGKKKIPDLALNEFYIAAERPYHTARYYFTARRKRERQKSSGILVSTAAGSYAWVKSAGGKILPLESDKFEYLIREPYCGRTATKCSLVNGVLNRNEKVVIEFEVGRGVIIADSIAKEFIFKAKEKVTVKLSDNPVHSVFFKK